MALRLEADGLDALELTPEEGIAVESFDLGFPEVRRVAELRPNGNGTIDTTAYFGARAVSISATLLGATPSARRIVLDRLKSFCVPARRPYLVYVSDDGDERQLRLVVDQLGAPVTAGALARVQVAWRAPDGVSYSTQLDTGAVNPGGGTEEGRSYGVDRGYDRTYPAYFGPGSVQIVNAGTIDTDPVLRVFGPVTDPVIENETLGKELRFVGLTVVGGEYVEIDVAARTVRSNSDPSPAANRYGTLDFAWSDWWSLAPGLNVLRFAAATSASPALLEVQWHAAWL